MKSVFFILILLFPTSLFSQSAEKSASCTFDLETLLFKSTPIEQARCFLRPVKMYGELDAQLTELPEPLEKLIGNKVRVDNKKLRGF